LSHPAMLLAQKGNGNVVTQERQLASFNAIEAGSAVNVFLSQGSTQSVKVEIDENLLDRFKTEVKNGTLTLNVDKVNNATKMNAYVTTVTLKKIETNGAASVKGQTPLASDNFEYIGSGASSANFEMKAGDMKIDLSGASKANFKIGVNTLKTDVSGAGALILTGSADNHDLIVSGAGNVKAMELVTDVTNAEISGAGNAKVMAKQQLKTDVSGAGNISYFDNGEMKQISAPDEKVRSLSGMENIKSVIIEDENGEKQVLFESQEDGDSVRVQVGAKKVVIITDDTVKVKLGNNEVVVNDEGNVKVKHEKKKNKFNGHWTGLELGVNGYLTPDMDFNYPSAYSGLEQNYVKSTNVNFNLLEQNFNLINNKLGLVTGVGFTWNNYRFDATETRLEKRDGIISVYNDQNTDIRYIKSKLVVSYLTVPLMLEYQTNPRSKSNSFHLGAGMVGGLRIGSHTKYVYDDGGKQKDKNPGDFYLNPFKVDGIVKIGWGVVNLYGTYSFSTLFRSGKGPELYPFSVGICITDLTDL
jgi:hypothetical protein